MVQDQGRTLEWLYEQAGVAKSTYNEMWGRESVRVLVLQDIAAALNVPLVDLLYGAPAKGSSVAAEPAPAYGQRFIEQRIADLERDVRELGRQLRLKKPSIT